MQLVIDIPEEIYKASKIIDVQYEDVVQIPLEVIANGTPIPKGHGRLKDENEIIKAIEDRVEFLRNNDAIFRRLRKDIDILGCIPKIRYEVSTIIEADNAESEEEERKW